MKKFILLPILILVASCINDNDVEEYFLHRTRSEELKGKWIKVTNPMHNNPDYFIFDNFYKRRFLYNEMQNKYFQNNIYFWYNDEQYIYFQEDDSFFYSSELEKEKYYLNPTKDTLTLGESAFRYYKEK